MNTDDSWEFVQEDLTRRELLQIANEINPDRGHSLSSILHQSTHVWTEMSHLHPPLSPRDKIFSVLEKWFENISESPENRRTLANACRRVEQLRVASRIARKSYVTSWHFLPRRRIVFRCCFVATCMMSSRRWRGYFTTRHWSTSCAVGVYIAPVGTIWRRQSQQRPAHWFSQLLSWPVQCTIVQKSR